MHKIKNIFVGFLLLFPIIIFVLFGVYIYRHDLPQSYTYTSIETVSTVYSGGSNFFITDSNRVKQSNNTLKITCPTNSYSCDIYQYYDEAPTGFSIFDYRYIYFDLNPLLHDSYSLIPYSHNYFYLLFEYANGTSLQYHNLYTTFEHSTFELQCFIDLSNYLYDSVDNSPLIGINVMLINGLQNQVFYVAPAIVYLDSNFNIPTTPTELQEFYRGTLFNNMTKFYTTNTLDKHSYTFNTTTSNIPSIIFLEYSDFIYTNFYTPFNRLFNGLFDSLNRGFAHIINYDTSYLSITSTPYVLIVSLIYYYFLLTIFLIFFEILLFFPRFIYSLFNRGYKN